MWVLVVVVEHAVLLVKFAIKALHAGEAEWIQDARDALLSRAESDLKIDGAAAAAHTIDEMRRQINRLSRELDETKATGGGCTTGAFAYNP